MPTWAVDCVGVIVTLSWSSSAGFPLPGVESVSGWSALVTSPVLVFAPAVSTVAVMVSVADAPPGSVPTVHTPVPES